MDNKEEFTMPSQNEEIVENTTEIKEEAVEEITTGVKSSDGYASQFGELGIQEETPVAVKKKQFPIYVPVIVAACILIGSIVTFLLINIFTPTIEGTWIYKAEDGNSFYYTFKNDECDMSIGTIHFPGTYSTVATEEGRTANIELYAGYIAGAYDFEVSGNKLSRDRVLKLTGEDGTELTLTESKAVKDSDYIMPDENFKPVEELTGEWEFEYAEYGSSLKLTLNEDGTMVYDQFGYQKFNCVYTATENTINFSFFETELISQEEEYDFNDKGELIFLGLNWTRVDDTATADQK